MSSSWVMEDGDELMIDRYGFEAFCLVLMLPIIAQGFGCELPEGYLGGEVNIT